MQITITRTERNPSWETVQKLVRELTGTDGHLTKIDRADGGCNYRLPGTYKLRFKHVFGGAVATLPITLTLE